MSKVIKIVGIIILALLFINFVLGHIILFVINNILPVLLISVIAFFLLRRHDRKRGKK